ncbi:MAG: creatininase family protein [Chloroflexaceae bacterium]|nr:creatininase family protein [Chloroflexaceae bacterium]
MSSTPPPWGRYVDLHPNKLHTIRISVPIAYLPWGSLEWHGPHLPFGINGMIAEAITDKLVRRTGGVVLPTTWWPATVRPHDQSLSITSDVMHAFWDNLFTDLARASWRVVVVLSGPYSPGHEMVLMDAAETAMKEHQLLVLALPPLALVDDKMLDYGGLWETSMMLALYPGLVALHTLGDAHSLTPTTSGILGRDPRGASSQSLGETVIGMAIERIERAVLQLLQDNDPAPLHAIYERRRMHYQEYLEQCYHGSHDQAVIEWWQRQCNNHQ